MFLINSDCKDVMFVTHFIISPPLASQKFPWIRDRLNVMICVYPEYTDCGRGFSSDSVFPLSAALDAD